MVQVRYEIRCSCGAKITDHLASGDSDRYQQEFSCPHFRCSRYHKTTLGWFFGSNANASVCF